MSNIVTSISQARGARRGAPALTPDLQLSVPFDSDHGPALKQALEEAALQQDVRALWMGFPNLEEASKKLLNLISWHWPARNRGRSAAVVAIIRAVERVKAGLEADENSRDQVVSNYLTSLCEVASDVAGSQAWGFKAGRPLEQYEHGKGTFDAWANGGQFDEIRFFFRSETSNNEVAGTRMRLLCAIATTKDIGIVSRLI